MAEAQRQPQSLPEKAFPVSWDQFHRDARALAWRLAAAGPFTAIVAITRGGVEHAPARLDPRVLHQPGRDRLERAQQWLVAVA